jgi:hypothetical protein
MNEQKCGRLQTYQRSKGVSDAGNGSSRVNWVELYETMIEAGTGQSQRGDPQGWVPHAVGRVPTPYNLIPI